MLHYQAPWSRLLLPYMTTDWLIDWLIWSVLIHFSNLIVECFTWFNCQGRRTFLTLTLQTIGCQRTKAPIWSWSWSCHATTSTLILSPHLFPDPQHLILHTSFPLPFEIFPLPIHDFFSAEGEKSLLPFPTFLLTMALVGDGGRAVTRSDIWFDA